MADYSDAKYWEERYTKDSKPFEWLQRYRDVQQLLNEHVPKTARVLDVGSGTSQLAVQMVDDGYAAPIVSIDISTVAVDAMQALYGDRKEQLQYKNMDACSMEFDDKAFDAVVDKGTLDSLLCGDNADGDRVKMLTEVDRVLSDNGVLVSFSHSGPDERLHFFKNERYNWTVAMLTIPKPAVMGSEGVQYVYICKKQPQAHALAA